MTETTAKNVIPARYQTARGPALGDVGEVCAANQPFDTDTVALYCCPEFWSSGEEQRQCDPFVGVMATMLSPSSVVKEGDKVLLPRVGDPRTVRHMGDLVDTQMSVDLFRVRIWQDSRYLEYLGTYFGVLPGEGSNLIQDGRGAWFPLSPEFRGMPVVPPDSLVDMRAVILEQEADNAFLGDYLPGSGFPDPVAAEPNNLTTTQKARRKASTAANTRRTTWSTS